MSGPTILVVDDNPTIRKMIRVALGVEGYSVVEAADAGEGLESFAASRPALVLQDLLLPDLDGLELMRKLRELPGGEDVPIVACSGMLSKLEEARLLGVGFDDFLLKPVELSRLVQLVRGRVPLAPRPPLEERRGQRVLVADDDPVRRELHAQRLRLAGFEVETACDGNDALTKARAAPPDAIASDILMPELDGFGLCLAVRLDRDLARVPVVLYSGAHQEDLDRELAERVGANALVEVAGELGPLLEAMDLGLARGAPLPPVHHVELHQQARVHRVLRHLERQVAAAAGLTRRCAAQAAELSVLAGVARALSGPGDEEVDLEAILGDGLARCLEAGECSLAALYRGGPDGLALVARAGLPALGDEALRSWLGQPELLAGVSDRRVVVRLPSPDEPAGEGLLSRAGLRSAALAPALAGGESLGVLLLGSLDQDLPEEAADFAWGVAAQLGVALALARRLQQAQGHLRERDQLLGAGAEEPAAVRP